MGTLDRGYFNNQAVQVLNYVDYDADGNPIGLKEGQNDPTSANFGTLREPRRGGCYRGNNGSSYVNCGTIGDYNWHNCFDNFTLSLRMYLSELPNVNASLIGKSTSAQNSSRLAIIYRADNKIEYGVLQKDSSPTPIPYTFEARKFYYIEIKYVKSINSLVSKIYADNNLVNTYTYSLAGTNYNYTPIPFLIHGYWNADRSGMSVNSSNLIHISDVKVSKDSTLLAHYKCDENFGTVCYDSSGNGYHGTIMNAVTTTPETNPNSIHQYNDFYSWHNETGYSKVGSAYIPRNESVVLPPFKDVQGNNLQFIGKVPGKAKYVQSNCYIGAGTTANLVLPTTFPVKQNFSLTFDMEIPNAVPSNVTFLKNIFRFGTLKFYTLNSVGFIFSYTDGSAVATSQQGGNAQWNWNNLLGKTIKVTFKRYNNKADTFIEVVKGSPLNISSVSYTAANPGVTYGNTNNYLDFNLLAHKSFNVIYKELDINGNPISTVAYWPLCEEIINPVGHIYHDVSGNGNHATLTNGAVGNNGVQDQFHYLQKGFTNVGEFYNIINIQEAVNSGLITILSPLTPTFDSLGNLTFSGVNTRVHLRVNLTVFNLVDNFTIYEGSIVGENLNVYIRFISVQTLVTSFTGTKVLQGQIFNITQPEIDGIAENELVLICSNVVVSTLTGIRLKMLSNLPKHLTNNTDYLGNALTHTQDGKSFLPSGCRLQQPQQPSLIQADQSTKFWYDINNIPYEVEWDRLRLVDPISEKIFVGNKDPKRISPISTHVNALVQRQRLTERVVRNVVDTVSDNSFQFVVSIPVGDLTYSYTSGSPYTTNGIFEWGDGTSLSVNTSTTQTFTKTYASAGTYIIKFTGTLGSFKPFQTNQINANKVIKILNWGQCSIRHLHFTNCSNLITIPNGPITGLDQINSQAAQSPSFLNCSKLSIEIPEDLLFYAKKSTDLALIFNGCTSLIGNIPENLFRYCPDVTTVDSAFAGCTGLNGQIPTDLLKYNTKITTVANLFVSCSGLSGSIPANIFQYNTEITNFQYVFRGCTGLSGIIPSDLFRYNTKAQTFYGTFQFDSGLTGTIPQDLFKYNTLAWRFQETLYGCTGLTGSIPADLFKYNNTVNLTFYQFFHTCTGLSGAIPSTLFANNSNTLSLNGTFYGCTGLTSIGVGVFDLIPLCTGMNSTFYGCSNITTIPVDLFKYAVGVVDFGNIFINCISITSIPNNLFDYCPNVTNFGAAFSGTRIASIPLNLFINNTKVTSFAGTFGNNPSLTAVPSNLFDINTLVTDMSGVFNLTKITTIPSNLFLFNIKVTTFANAFYGCNELTAIPANLFDSNTLVTSFAGTFYSCNNAALTTLPTDLFKFNTLVTTFAECFRATKFTSMPVDIFRYNTAVRNFTNLFYQAALNVVDVSIFYYNVNVTSFVNTFAGSKITSIPTGIFDTNIKTTSFNGCFDFTPIIVIPVDLFRQNTLVTSFSITFNNCTSLTTVPQDLFRYNVEVTSFNNVFANCTSLIILPEDLFYYNTKVTTYTQAFSGTRNIALPTRMFNTSNLGKVTTWVNFMNVTQTSFSPTGIIQKIWSTTDTPAGDVTYPVAPTVTDAFNNCTAISNYATEIPTTWK